jgi:hypothetical protein
MMPFAFQKSVTIFYSVDSASFIFFCFPRIARGAISLIAAGIQIQNGGPPVPFAIICEISPIIPARYR